MEGVKSVKSLTKAIALLLLQELRNTHKKATADPTNSRIPFTLFMYKRVQDQRIPLKGRKPDVKKITKTSEDLIHTEMRRLHHLVRLCLASTASGICQLK